LLDIPVCGACQQELKDGIAAGRVKVLERLPGLFGLAQGWEELHKSESDAD